MEHLGPAATPMHADLHGIVRAASNIVSSLNSGVDHLAAALPPMFAGQHQTYHDGARFNQQQQLTAAQHHHLAGHDRQWLPLQQGEYQHQAASVHMMQDFVGGAAGGSPADAQGRGSSHASADFAAIGAHLGPPPPDGTSIGGFQARSFKAAL